MRRGFRGLSQLGGLNLSLESSIRDLPSAPVAHRSRSRSRSRGSPPGGDQVLAIPMADGSFWGCCLERYVPLLQGNGSRALQQRRRSGLFYAIYVLPILLLYLCVFLLNWVLIRTAGSIELRRVQRRLVRRAGRRSASRWRGYVRTRRSDR